ncbi:MAG: amino acid ABC transporter substrate-binding protein [Deltaproteobacteria bacterium]|nr:amino acid ABC transporter substrate-binding protein [Deltaproteobacteria bacterium]
MSFPPVRLLACALAALCFACATSNAPTPLAPAVPLRVGVTPDMAPYVFQRADGFAGLEIDFAERLAAALGRPLELVRVPWDEQIQTLLGGGTDVIMSGMSITPARAARVAFGDGYMTTSLQGVVRLEDAERWPTPEALLRTSPRIGVKSQTTGEALVRERRPDEDIVVYRRSRDAVWELMNYRIDAYVSDAPVIEAAVLAHPDKLVAYPRAVGEQSLAWAFRPGDEALRQAANDVLRSWRAGGTLRQILAAWPSIVE